MKRRTDQTSLLSSHNVLKVFQTSSALAGLTALAAVTLLASPANATSGVTNWKAVATGRDHTCAIRDSDNRLFCWGENAYGQLGIGNTTDKLVPTAVGTSQWKLISAGDGFTCGLKTDNKRWCWGRNTEGQLGINSTTNRTSPTQLSGETSSWWSVYAGGRYACGILLNGSSPSTAKCWGDNFEGNLGTGGTSNTLVPTNVVMSQVTPGGTVFKHMSVALADDYRVTCAVTNQNPSKRYCWGFIGNAGDVGATGLPFSVDLNGDGIIPQPLPSGENYTTLTVGGYHACGVTGGVLKCWGWNDNGELGDETHTDRELPVTVHGGITDWAEVSGGGDGFQGFTCAKRSTGMGYCWGWGGADGLGTSLDQVYPQYDLDQQWTNIQAGNRHACGVTAAKKLMCWGENLQGQLGMNDQFARYAPTYVVDP